MAIAGDSMYWFLYCLVICTCILWITRRLLAWLAMVASFAPLGLLMVHEQSTPIVYNTMLFAPVFVAGARIKPAFTWLSEHTFRWTALVPTVGLGPWLFGCLPMAYGIPTVVCRTTIGLYETMRRILWLAVSLGACLASC